MERPELQKAQTIRDTLIPILEKQIIGKTMPGWQCCCGAKHGESKAIAVIPAGTEFPYQVTIWDLWSVRMREIDTNAKVPDEYSFSCSMSQFIPSGTLEQVFSDAFANIDEQKLYRESEGGNK